MKKVFIDTNLFIRYLVNDIPEMADQVERLFDKAEKGDIVLVTGPPVFFELAWTLKSFYKKTREYIHECMLSVMGIPGLEVLDSELLERALELYRNTNADFGDAYIVASAEAIQSDRIATFNKKHFKNQKIELYDFE